MNQRREPVRFLVLSASLRAGSLNGRLAQLAANLFGILVDMSFLSTHAYTEGRTRAP
jgi:hypothetical protein